PAQPNPTWAAPVSGLCWAHNPSGSVLAAPGHELLVPGCHLCCSTARTGQQQPAHDVLHQLPTKARGTAKGIDPQNDLTCLRIRSKKHKIMITPVSISVRTVELCT
uniref:Uncharacterized protein n=1 Tax=Junco hyemalis TaxID=40217 RepID=A0A8C5NK01_JUNHY